MRRLRIVHCANFSESKLGKVFYAIDRKISNGLIRNGHFVYDFSYREIARASAFLKRKKWGASKMNEKLLETIRQIEPDLLLLGHSELVTVETIAKIREMFPRTKIAMWWVDPFDRSGHIDGRLPYLDAFFATTDPDYYSRLFKNRTAFFYMPNPCDDSIETDKAFENESYLHDLVFIGRNDEKRKELIGYLKGLDFLNVGIYGDTKETLVFGRTFLKKIASSKMAVNYSRYNDIPLYSSDRVIQLLAQGTLVFSPRIPGFERLFSDEEIVYFDSMDDLTEKLRFYHRNDTERIRIARNGWQKAHERFDVTQITKEMLEEIYKEEQ